MAIDSIGQWAQGSAPALLRDLGIYGGAQGVWVDKQRTSAIAPDGVAVGLLHTGSSYPDDVSENCVLYHYPVTNRPKSRDLGEIQATKNAGLSSIPVFVITYPTPGSTVRDVALSWVESWDDELKQFLVSFGDEAPLPPEREAQDDGDFRLTSEPTKRRREVAAREGQQRFKFRVLQRYGPQCAVCGIAVPEVLDAAHLRPKRRKGSDHPGNGLVLCATHHRAQEAGLFGIEPETCLVLAASGGPSLQDLGIVYEDLGHLRAQPHVEALRWLWEQWKHQPS